jgi:hypothetical protein
MAKPTQTNKKTHSASTESRIQNDKNVESPRDVSKYYLGNGDAGQELVQLFVVSDGEQQVSEITSVVLGYVGTVPYLYPVFTCGSASIWKAVE